MKEQKSESIDRHIHQAWHCITSDPHRSRELLEQARSRSEEAGDRKSLLQIRIIEAINLYFRSGYDEAAGEAEDVLERSREIDDPFSEALALYLLGMWDRLKATPTAAIIRYDEALEAIARVSDPHTEAKIRSERARSVGSAGRREEAIRLLEEVEQTGRDLDSKDVAAHALYGQAVNRLELGDFDRAGEELDRVIAVAEHEGFSILLASALQAKNVILNGVGRTTEALEVELRIAEEWLRNDYLRGAGLSLCNAGFMAIELGSYEQALGLLTRALDLADRKSLPDIEAIALQQIGQIYEALEEYDLIPEYQLRSMQIARAIEDPFTELVALYFLSRHYQRGGHLSRALAGYLRCLDLARQTGRRATESSLHEAIGELHVHSRQWEEAERELSEAVAIARENELARESSAALKTLAGLRMEQENLVEAEELLREAIRTAADARLFVLHHEGLRDLRRLGETKGDEGLVREAELEAGRLVGTIFDSDSARRVRSLLHDHEESHLRYHVTHLGLGEEERGMVERFTREWGRRESRSQSGSGSLELYSTRELPQQGIHVRTFGRFLVLCDGEEVPQNAWKRKRARDLFKLLVVDHGTVVTVDRIEEALWGEPTSGIDSLVMNAASHIRGALDLAKSPEASGPKLLRTSDGYLLDLGDQRRVDLFGFKEMIVAARHAPKATEKAEFYRRALEIADGPFMPDDRDLEWTSHYRGLVEDAWFEGAEFVARKHLRAGDTGEAIDQARQILMREETNQSAWEILLTSLMAAGRTGTAREEFEHCRRAYHTLFEEEPPEALRSLVHMSNDR